MGSPRLAPAANAAVLVLTGPIARADIPVICERTRVRLECGGAGPVVCDVGALTEADVGTVDVLARLLLTARRLGREVRLSGVSCELREVLTLVGLCDALPPSAALWLEPGGQTEEREQARGVEEEADPRDPTG
jgi:ABC-type transporter Mla MlaB component